MEKQLEQRIAELNRVHINRQCFLEQQINDLETEVRMSKLEKGTSMDLLKDKIMHLIDSHLMKRTKQMIQSKSESVN